MMKNIYTAVSLLIAGISVGQNLVPNPGFEEITDCPTGQAGIELAAPWTQPGNTAGTSDLYHSCNQNGFGSPSNITGYQQAHSGSAYAGIYTFGANSIREYLQVQLTSPLEAGATYAVEMYVTPAEIPGIACDAIGIYFSAEPLTGTGDASYFPAQSQVNSPQGVIISDTSSWTLVSGLFTAGGGETYITIGNFKSDEATDTFMFESGGWQRGYYRVDDISVTLAIAASNAFPGANEPRIYPNPFRDELRIENLSTADAEIIIYDLTGRKLLQQTAAATTSINTSGFSAGIYFYEITGKTGIIKKGKIVK